MATTRGIQAWTHDRFSLWNVPLYEWSVFLLLCLFHVAHFGLCFFTSCRDGRLFRHMERPPGTEGNLFSFPSRVLAFIRTVGVNAIILGTAFLAENAYELLNCIDKVDWQRTPRFL